MAQGIWQILTWALKSFKNFHFNVFFLTKVWNVSSKKTELPFMRLNSDAKFEEKLTCGMENDMENLTKLHQRTQKSVSKLGYWCDPFIQSRKDVRLESAEELCDMTMKNYAKFEEELNCRFKTDMRNLANFDPSTQKSQRFELFDQSILLLFTFDKPWDLSTNLLENSMSCSAHLSDKGV